MNHVKNYLFIDLRAIRYLFIYFLTNHSFSYVVIIVVVVIIIITITSIMICCNAFGRDRRDRC